MCGTGKPGNIYSVVCYNCFGSNITFNATKISGINNIQVSGIQPGYEYIFSRVIDDGAADGNRNIC